MTTLGDETTSAEEGISIDGSLREYSSSMNAAERLVSRREMEPGGGREMAEEDGSGSRDSVLFLRKMVGSSHHHIFLLDEKSQPD